MKKIALFSTFVIAALGFAGGAFAQTGTARGKVLDQEKKPVEAVTIKIEYLGGVTRAYETKTNKKGEYTQVGLQPGDYKVTASKEAYQGAYAEAKINLGDPTYLPDLIINSAAAKQAEANAANEELQALFKKGYEAAQAQDFATAEASYKEAIAKQPEMAQAYFNLGYVYMQKKDWANAEAQLDIALQKKPDYDAAQSLLATVYTASGQTEKANAIISTSKDPKLLLDVGVGYLNSSKAAEARDVFLKAEAADPSISDVQYLLGNAALQMGDYAEAVVRWEKYLAMNPANAQYKEAAEKMLPDIRKAAAAPKQPQQ
jgi:tetratricopeptide (TPR) repeat protein